MDKKETENEPVDLFTPGERGIETLEEAFRILRSLPDSVERDEVVWHVLDIAEGAQRRVRERHGRKR